MRFSKYDSINEDITDSLTEMALYVTTVALNVRTVVAMCEVPFEHMSYGHKVTVVLCSDGSIDRNVADRLRELSAAFEVPISLRENASIAEDLERDRCALWSFSQEEWGALS